jgi:hypothetical protein
LGVVEVISCREIAFPILIKEALRCNSRCSSRFTILFIEAILVSISYKAAESIIDLYFFARVGVLLVNILYHAAGLRSIEERMLIAA